MDSAKTTRVIYAAIMFLLAFGQFANPWIMRWIENQGRGPSPIDTHFYGWVAVSLLVAVAFVFVGILNLRAGAPGKPQKMREVTSALPAVSISDERRSDTRQSNQPNVQFRVVRGITGNSPQYGDPTAACTELIIRVRLINRESQSITFRATEWSASLMDGDGGYITSGGGKAIPAPLRFEEVPRHYNEAPVSEMFDKDLIADTSKAPMVKDVPVEGWLRFVCSHIRLEHMFGATIRVYAKDDLDRAKDFEEKRPGEWLVPAKIYFASSETRVQRAG